MASNPIQKKVRNAGLIGAMITLLIMSVIVAFLLIQLSNMKNEQKAVEEASKIVYTLRQNVSAGTPITTDMLQKSTAQIDHIPSNAISNLSKFSSEEPVVAKIDMAKNTVLTPDMLADGTVVTDDIRKQEYNAVILPIDLATGDYIDIRLQLPTGQDFIVISKKMVEIPIVEGMDSEDTIWLELSEDEILTMACAIVESYRINGSKLYATKYTEPGIQAAAIPTYPVSGETKNLIEADPNVTEEAEKALRERYNNTFISIRNEQINNELGKPENSLSNVTNKMNESIVKTQEERKDYLQSLGN